MNLIQRWIAGALLVGLAAGCSNSPSPSAPKAPALAASKAGEQKSAASKSGLEIPPPP
jgi:hypothetical protein